MCKLGKVVLYALSMLLITSQQTAIALDDFDLYRYGKDAKLKVERKEFIVKLVLYDTEAELNDAYYQDRERPEGAGVRGFALSDENQDVCYIHIKAAAIWDNREHMAILGHELYHCALAKHPTATYATELEMEAKVEVEPTIKETALAKKDTTVDIQTLIDESQAMMLDLLTWECSDDNPYKETFDLTCDKVSN